MDEILFDELKEALKRVQSRAEHLADHSNENIAKAAHRITMSCDDIRDCTAWIEREIAG